MLALSSISHDFLTLMEINNGMDISGQGNNPPGQDPLL